MQRALLHMVASTAVIGGAASLALAVSGGYDISRVSRDDPPRYQCKAKVKVSDSRARWTEKYHMSVGDGFVSSNGVSCSGSLEASRHDRPSFFFGIYAPVGNGTASESFIKCKFDSNKGTPQGTMLDRDEFGFALEALDGDIGNTGIILFKKPPVAVNGDFDVERLKVKGKVKESRGQLSGSLKFSGTGTITSGENQGKRFKASLKTKIRRAPSFDQQ